MLLQKEAEECIDYLGNQLNSADTSYLPVLLQQLLHIGTQFPDLLKIHMINVASIGESKEVEVKRLVRRLIELVDMKWVAVKHTSEVSNFPGRFCMCWSPDAYARFENLCVYSFERIHISADKVIFFPIRAVISNYKLDSKS